VVRASGSAAQGHFSLGPQEWTSFCIGDRACRYPGSPDLSNGDRVTVVGDGTGELDVLVLQNETTGSLYSRHEGEGHLLPLVIGGCILIGVGVPVFLGYLTGSLLVACTSSLIWSPLWVGIAWTCSIPLRKQGLAARTLSGPEYR
jgi:hypothetical protein